MSEERHDHDLEVEAEREEDGPGLDPEVEARRVAAMSFIRRLGDPVLKSRATEVDRFDESLRRQVSRMAGIMGDALGVGLAAPQLGISQRLLVYRVGPDAPVIALVNPQIEWWSDELEALEEGCLSIPEYYEEVERPAQVKVKFTDLDGRAHEIEADGLLATVLQHEIDHTNGVLFIDHISKLKRDRVIKKFTKAAKREAE